MNSRDWHTHTPDELETTLQANLDRGLTEWETQQRLAKHGTRGGQAPLGSGASPHAATRGS
jgi:hypothetical protein